MDLSKLSDSDLQALSDRNYSAMSTEGLEYIRGQREPKSQGVAKDFSMGAYRGLTNLYGLPISALNWAKNKVAPDKPDFWGTAEDTQKLLKEQGIDVNSSPRNLPGIMGEYMMPSGLVKNAAKEVGEGALAAVGGYVGRELDPDNPLAEMLGALTPAGLKYAGSGAARRLARKDAAAMQERIALADKLRAPITVGTTGQSGPAMALEKMTSAIPGGTTPYRRSGEKAATAMRQRLSTIAGGEADDIVRAGRLVVKGLFEDMTGWVARTAAKRNSLYNALDTKIGGDTMIDAAEANRFAWTANRGVAKADALSKGTFVDDVILKRTSQFLEDRASNNGQIPYEAVKKLRTEIGDMLGDRELIGSARRKMLGDFYEALSQDMRVAAAKEGPDALRLFDRANRYHKARIARIEDFYTALDKKVAPEDVWKAAMGDSPKSATRLHAIRKGLTDSEWGYVRRTLITRMGKPVASAATEGGPQFSAQSFLTNYEGMKRNGTLDVVFGRGQFRKDMDEVSRYASGLRESAQVLANPSGTAALGLGASILYGALSMGAGWAVGAGSVAGVAGMAGGVAANMGIARLLNNPKFVRWLAQSNTLPINAIPGHLERLAKIAGNDPELLSVLPDYIDRVEASLPAQATGTW